MMSRRVDRVNVLMRQEISRVLANELKDPRLSPIVSITRVATSGDLRHAKVYVSVLGGAAEQKSSMTALKSAAGFIHHVMRNQLKMRAVPSLTFYLDDSIARAPKSWR